MNATAEQVGTKPCEGEDGKDRSGTSSAVVRRVPPCAGDGDVARKIDSNVARQHIYIYI